MSIHTPMMILVFGAWGQEEVPPEDEEEPALEVIVRARPWANVKRAPVVANPDPETTYTLSQRDIDATPGALGDPLRAVHTLPGVVSDGDLAAGFHVRGGEQRDVVFLLDRVPLDNPFHLAGFNSLFNPDLVSEIRFHPSAAPASLPSGTSAVVEVSTWDGSTPHGIDGAIELSVTGARLLARGPVDNAGRLTVALAARRSWVEGYVAALKALDVVDQATVAPEFSELSGRIAWRPHRRHRLMLTGLRAADSLRLADSDDPAQVEFDGALDLESELTLTSLDHRYLTPSGSSLQTTFALTRDQTLSDRELERDTLLRDTVLTRYFARTDLSLPFSRNGTLKAGIDLSRFSVRADGMLQDTRTFPTWAQGGVGAFGFQVVSVAPERPPWLESSGYLQTEIGAAFGRGEPIAAGVPIVPGVKAQTGLRYVWSGLTGQISWSPRAGLSVPLPTGTIPKARIGLYPSTQRDPFRLDPDFGNPALRPEWARHLVLGVDQGFPLPDGHGLLRLEAYDILLSDLIVNPDIVDPVPYQNAGKGSNRGLDMMFAARTSGFNLQLAYGLLFARRQNPLNTVWPSDVLPPQDQRHTLSIAADLELGAWLFLSRYTFHSGRPTSEVAVLDLAFSSIQLDCLNCARIGPTHSIDLRTEWSHSYRAYRLMLFLEVLNVGNIRSPYLPVHDVIDGGVRTGSLDHLPMRPLFGARAEF